MNWTHGVQRSLLKLKLESGSFINSFARTDVMKKAVFASSALTLMLPLFVLAQTGVTPIPTPVTNFTGLINIINRVADILFTLLLVLAVIFILFAAFNYLTAMGNPEKVKAANNVLIYAAVAIAIATLAKGIPIIVRSIVG